MTQQFTMRTRAEVTPSSTALPWWTPGWCSPRMAAVSPDDAKVPGVLWAGVARKD